MVGRTPQSDFSSGVTATHKYHVFCLGSGGPGWSSWTLKAVPPAPDLHPFLSAKVKAGKTTHVFLSPFSRPSWLPPDEPSSTSARAGISPGTVARWLRPTEGSTQWKTSLRGNASWNRQTAIPSACAVPAASWRTGIWSEKMLGKAKSKSKEG